MAELGKPGVPRRGIFGWMMFDWAAQPFFTVVTTFIFGALHARQAWVYAFIIGLSIFAFHIALRITGLFTGVWLGPINGLIGLIALIPAFIGAYCGAGLRWVLDGFNESQKYEA